MRSLPFAFGIGGSLTATVVNRGEHRLLLPVLQYLELRRDVAQLFLDLGEEGLEGAVLVSLGQQQLDALAPQGGGEAALALAATPALLRVLLRPGASAPSSSCSSSSRSAASSSVSSKRLTWKGSFSLLAANLRIVARRSCSSSSLMRIPFADGAVAFLDGLITRLDLLLVRGDTASFSARIARRASALSPS
jgi:hypothetical protein